MSECWQRSSLAGLIYLSETGPGGHSRCSLNATGVLEAPDLAIELTCSSIRAFIRAANRREIAGFEFHLCPSPGHLLEEVLMSREITKRWAVREEAAKELGQPSAR